VDGGGWRRGTFVHNRTMRAYRSDGRAFDIAKWNAARGIWVATAWGKDYFKYNKMEFIVNVPCILYYRDDEDQGETIWRKCTINHRRGGRPLRKLIPKKVMVHDTDQDEAEVRPDAFRKSKGSWKRTQTIPRSEPTPRMVTGLLFGGSLNEFGAGIRRKR